MFASLSKSKEIVLESNNIGVTNGAKKLHFYHRNY